MLLNGRNGLLEKCEILISVVKSGIMQALIQIPVSLRLAFWRN